MNMSIKMRLILLGTILAFVPALVISILLKNVAITDSSTIIKHDVESKLVALRDVTATSIEDYLGLINDQIITYSDSFMVVEAMSRLAPAFHRYEGQVFDTDLKTQKEGLKQFYRNEFDKKYREFNANDSSFPDDLFKEAGKAAWIYQSLYISENPAALGEKNNMITSEVENSYTRYHSKFHPSFNQYLQTFGYYDIFLVDVKQGNIIYSVFKEIDYATSLKDGPYANSGIGDAYRKALTATQKNQTFLTDFKPYTPSYNSASAFMSSPIFKNNEMIGVVIFQMPVSKINGVMNHHDDWKNSGLGETGETYLVGADKTLRNNARGLIEDKEKYLASMINVGVGDHVIQELEAKGNAIGLQPADTVGVNKALEGETGVDIFTNPHGTSVLSAYKPLKVQDVNWVIMSEVSEEEAFQELKLLEDSLSTHITWIVVIFLGVGALLGWLLAKIIITPINTVITTVYGIAQGEGDLTQRLKVKGKDETAVLSKGINMFIEHIDNTFSSILDSVVRLIPISQDMADVNHKISDASSKQKKHSEEINDLLTTTNSSTQVVDKKLGQISDAIISGNKVVESSSQTVEGVNTAMTALSENIIQAVDAIDKLTKDTDRISGIIDVINGIAEQTNLLALNAAIEAARAGEAGRGFAVVADEVRTLASKTRQSTDEVTEMVNTIQSSTKSVVSLMDDSKKNADNSSENVSQATEELALVKEAMRMISERVEDIAEAIKIQQTGFMEINQTYELMNLSFKEAQLSGEASTIVGNDIVKLGDTIMNKINGFTVTNQNWSTARRNQIRITEGEAEEEDRNQFQEFVFEKTENSDEESTDKESNGDESSAEENESPIQSIDDEINLEEDIPTLNALEEEMLELDDIIEEEPHEPSKKET